MAQRILHIFRHSNGYHETKEYRGKEEDARLTPQGIENAYLAGLEKGISPEVDLVGAWSSLTRIRTNQTLCLQAYSKIVDDAQELAKSDPDSIAIKAREIVSGNKQLVSMPTRALDYDWKNFRDEIKSPRRQSDGLGYLLSKQPEYVAGRIAKLRELLNKVMQKPTSPENDSKGYICGHSSDLEFLLISLAQDFGTVDDLMSVWYGFPTGNGFSHNSGFTITHDQSSSSAVVTFGETQFDFPTFNSKL